jgi:very-short-patch-repair endonuclease
VKACGPHAVLARHSSLMLLGVLPPEERRPQVLVPHGVVRAPRGVVVHRTRNLDPEDIRRHKGIPTCSAARAIFDVAPRGTDRDVRRLMSRAQSTYRTNLRLLGRQLDRAQGRASARYARVLAAAPPPTRSELEDRLFDLIEASDLPRPDVNVPLRLEGRTVIPDFRWPDRRLVVEADGAQWHDNPQARAEDAARQALLERHGNRVVRVDWHQATAGASATRARITAAYSDGPGTGPRAASSASPMASTTSSDPAGPTSSMPTGSPSGVSPAGTDRAGRPAPDAGSVLRT